MTLRSPIFVNGFVSGSMAEPLRSVCFFRLSLLRTHILPKYPTVMSSGKHRRQVRAERKLRAAPLTSASNATSSKRDFFALGSFLLVAIVWLAVHPVMDPDIWLHMAFGRTFLQSGEIPKRDIFSFTAIGNEWISSGWAASVLFQVLYQYGDAAALVAIVVSVVVLVFGGLFAASARWFNCAWIAPLALLPALLASYLRFTPRPEIFSQLCLAGLFLVLLTFEVTGKARRLWLLPVLFLFWANLHAGFIVGLGAVGLFAGEQLLRGPRDRQFFLRIALPCSLCFITWLVNPYGFEIALLSQRIKDLPNVNLIVNEWKPMLGPLRAGLPASVLLGVWSLVFVCATVLFYNRHQVRFWHLAICALFVVLELREIRHTALAAIALAAVTLRHGEVFYRIFPQQRMQWLVIPVTAVAVIGIAVAQYSGKLGFGRGWPVARLDDSLLPFTATKFLQQHRPPPNLYNTYGPGGFLMYHLGPETKVFMDGRNDVYTPEVWNDHWEGQDGVIPLNVLVDKYKLNSFFIYCKHNPKDVPSLANRLTASTDWALCFFDDQYALFVKKSNAQYVAAHRYKHISPFDMGGLQQAMRNKATTDEAFAEIERALQLSNGSAKAHLIAGTAKRAVGRLSESESHMRQAQMVSPGVRVGQY